MSQTKVVHPEAHARLCRAVASLRSEYRSGVYTLADGSFARDSQYGAAMRAAIEQYDLETADEPPIAETP